MLYKDDYMLASLGDLRNLLELSNIKLHKCYFGTFGIQK